MQGWGISSILHALFDKEYSPESDFYINTDLGDYHDMVGILPYQTLPLLDMFTITDAFAVMYPFQKLLAARKTQRTSEPTYDIELQDELRDWTIVAMSQWL